MLLVGYLYLDFGDFSIMYSSAINAEWGIFALAIFYSYSWSQGTYNNFIKHGKKKE